MYVTIVSILQGCSASPQSDDNLYVWAATVFGPDETPWEGGVFSLRITFGDQYPEKPPRIRFTSEVFHPNGTRRVEQNLLASHGNACLVSSA